MAQFSINEEEVVKVCVDHMGAKDAMSELMEALQTISTVHNLPADFELAQQNFGYSVCWPGGPRQWAESIAATVSGKMFSMSANENGDTLFISYTN